MLDSKMLIVMLVLALIIFGTTRLRSMGTDVGAAMRDGDLPAQVPPPERVSRQD